MRSPASAGVIARDCERARFGIASLISPDYLRYQGIDDNLLQRSTLYSINLQLKLTQARPRSTGSDVFYKTLPPSSSLACLIFESSAANEILHSDKHSSPFKLLQPSSLQPRRCFLSWQLAAFWYRSFCILQRRQRSVSAGQAGPKCVWSFKHLWVYLLCHCPQKQVSELSRTFFK